MHGCGHDGAIGMPDAASINPCLCGARERQAALARIEADLSRREALGGTAAVLGMFAGFGLAPQFARAQIPGRPTVLANCSFIDGTTLKLHSDREIVVEGGKVSAIVGAGQGSQMRPGSIAVDAR